MKTLRRADLIALGVALGLSYQTASKRMGNDDQLLKHIVAAWLNREDNVISQSGEPTWSVLADKLEEIGHEEIAASIRKKSDGPQHTRGEGAGGCPHEDDHSTPKLFAGSADSSTGNQLNCANSSGQLCVPHYSDQTAGVSIQSVTLSDPDQPLDR